MLTLAVQVAHVPWPAKRPFDLVFTPYTPEGAEEAKSCWIHNDEYLEDRDAKIDPYTIDPKKPDKKGKILLHPNPDNLPKRCCSADFEEVQHECCPLL